MGRTEHVVGTTTSELALRAWREGRVTSAKCLRVGRTLTAGDHRPRESVATAPEPDFFERRLQPLRHFDSPRTFTARISDEEQVK